MHPREVDLEKREYIHSGTEGVSVMKLLGAILSFFLPVLVFSEEVKPSQFHREDSTENEYKVIARMINALNYKPDQDKKSIQQAELPEWTRRC